MKNLIIRSLSGLAFLVLVIGAIIYGPVTFAIVFGFIMISAMYEFLSIAFRHKDRADNIIIKSLSIVSAITLFYVVFFIIGYDLEEEFLLLPLLPMFAIFVVNLYFKSYNIHKLDDSGKKVSNGYEFFPFSLTAIIYIAIPFTIINLIVFYKGGIYDGNLLLCMLIMLWCTDVGAYCLGSTLGQKYNHRLFPSISPKKSWEGFWGGLICSVIAAIVLNYTELLPLSMAHSIALSVIICVFGVLGDLVESQLKRNFDVKDSGRIMPGHGGMLDRFDGALLSFPIAIVYLMFFAI